MQTTDKYDRKCMVCGAEWIHMNAVKNGYHLCPVCNTQVSPMPKEYSGYMQINWNELVLLATYAKRWSKIVIPNDELSVHLVMALNNILNKLKKYKPPNAPDLYPENDTVKIEVETSEKIELKPDQSGKILSPFYQPKQGPLQ